MGQSCEFPPGECSYGTGKVKLRPRQIFRVFPGVGEQPQGKRSKQQQHKCRFEDGRSEEHTSELQSLMRISYAVFCLKKKSLNEDNTYYSTPLLETTKPINCNTAQTLTCRSQQ